MSLQIGQTVPDFEADTTEGRIRFHDWIGDSWALLVRTPRLHARVHHRAWHDGRAEGRVRQTQYEGDRHQRRSGRLAHEVGGQTFAKRRGRRRTIRSSATRRSRSRSCTACCRPPSRAAPKAAQGGRQRDGAQRLRDRSRQEGQAVDCIYYHWLYFYECLEQD